jgi:DNA polymerase/3'-5' exonuclease PolX
MSNKRKRADGNMNEDIVEALTELAEWERNTNRNSYKANAYAKAAAAIGSLDYRSVFYSLAPWLPFHFPGLKYEEEVQFYLDCGS